jgi:hypothetical protein
MATTVCKVQPELLRTLPDDNVRQILWRFATATTCRCWCNRHARLLAVRWRSLSNKASAPITTGPLQELHA